VLTQLKGATTEVNIAGDCPVVIIGEKINPTGNKRLAAALRERDLEYVRKLALNQIAAGADVLDVNVGVPELDEVSLLPEVLSVLAAEVPVPFCLDSANPKALAAALAVIPGKPLVNSVNGGDKSLEAVLPIVKERGAAVIGLTMDENGIPNEPETRAAIAGRILERAAKLGIPAEDVIIDPLVLTVGADSKAGAITLRTIELVRREFGTNISLGASNVSFGLPDRQTLNQTFLALAIGAGTSCVITDPTKMTATVRAADLLLARDTYGKRFITYFRSHPQQAQS
jgi:5-methyltetrahydrofolate--homocysteine methyltransferase